MENKGRNLLENQQSPAAGVLHDVGVNKTTIRQPHAVPQRGQHPGIANYDSEVLWLADQLAPVGTALLSHAQGAGARSYNRACFSLQPAGRCRPQTRGSGFASRVVRIAFVLPGCGAPGARLKEIAQTGGPA